MSFRDDRDALVARVDGLDRELGQARQELADEQRAHKESRARERELVHKVDVLEKELAGLRPAPRAVTPSQRGSLYFGIGVAVFFLVVTVAIVGSRDKKPALLSLDAAPLPELATPRRQRQLRDLVRHATLICVRLALADGAEAYRSQREAARSGSRRATGRWNTCFDDLRSAAQEPGAAVVLTELTRELDALQPLFRRASELYGSDEHLQNRPLGEKLDSEIGTHLQAAQVFADRALAELRPAWLTAVTALYDEQAGDREGRMVALAIEIMVLGTEIAGEAGRLHGHGVSSARIPALVELVVRLRALADEDLTHEPPWPAARVLGLGNSVHLATAGDDLDEYQLRVAAWGLSQQLAETTNYKPRL